MHLNDRCKLLSLMQAFAMEIVVCVTWLFGFAQDRTAPGSRPDTVEGLNAELIVRPLFQSFYCHLTGKAVRNRLHPGLPKPIHSLCSYTITHTFRIPVICCLWKWLQKMKRKTGEFDKLSAHQYEDQIIWFELWCLNWIVS